jgi:leucyl aminopeptidase (aminopeptidase T)
MKNITVYENSQTIRVINSQEQLVASNVFQTCFKVKAGEKILIVTDPWKAQNEAAIFFEGAKNLKVPVQMLEFSGMTENAQEPPQTILEALLKAQVALLITRFSLSHTRAREKASDHGVRIASMPDITTDMILRTLAVDYMPIATYSTELALRLTKASRVHLTSPSGTDIKFSLKNRKGMADTGLLTLPGAFGNLPAGEAFVAPQEGTAEGVIVIDGALADINLDKPVIIEAQKGRALSIQGGKAAQTLIKSMEEAGKNAFILAEFGIGTNPNTQLSANVLESEKVLGTCHLAFGDNLGMGGKNEVAFHSDGIIAKPRIELDRRILKLKSFLKSG